MCSQTSLNCGQIKQSQNEVGRTDSWLWNDNPRVIYQTGEKNKSLKMKNYDLISEYDIIMTWLAGSLRKQIH